MGDSYYRFFPGDYHRDTGDLTMLEHGAYRLLLDHYYMKESLPADLERLYRICGAFSEEERTAVGTVVERFFKSDGKNLLNRKTEEELSKRKSFIETQREKGRKSAKSRAKKKLVNEPDSTGVGTGAEPGLEPGYQPGGQPKVNLPSPSPIKKPPIVPQKGDDGFDAFWKSYPRKVGKLKAREAWKRAKTKPDLQTILSALEKQKQSLDWTKENGQYVPHPATWLNRGGWDDEITPVCKANW